MTVNHDRYVSIKNVFKRGMDIYKVVYGEFSLPEFEYLQNNLWVFTEKLDGMNIRVILDDGVEFRGRSDRAHLPGPLKEHLRDTFDIESVREQASLYGEGLCLYGEGVGPGIQSGAKYGAGQYFVMFDVMTNHGWASRRDVGDIAKNLQIPVAPVKLTGTLWEAMLTVEKGLKSDFGDFFAEGLVGRPVPDLRNIYGDRIVVKIKHKDFYLGPRGLT